MQLLPHSFPTPTFQNKMCHWHDTTMQCQCDGWFLTISLKSFGKTSVFKNAQSFYFSCRLQVRWSTKTRLAISLQHIFVLWTVLFGFSGQCWEWDSNKCFLLFFCIYSGLTETMVPPPRRDKLNEEAKSTGLKSSETKQSVVWNGQSNHGANIAYTQPWESSEYRTETTSKPQNLYRDRDRML